MTFSHIGICISHMQRSMRFYTEALGFVFSHSVEGGPPFDVMTELPELELRASFLKRDGVMIELLQYVRPGTTGSAERRPMNQLGSYASKSDRRRHDRDGGAHRAARRSGIPAHESPVARG